MRLFALILILVSALNSFTADKVFRADTATSNVTAYQEFKRESNIPCQSKSSSLKIKNGIVVYPKDPDMGLEIDADCVKMGVAVAA
ncbi:MAG: hypothetical protein P8J63_05135 [Verrucomicrobiota bacterium]|nr:hypothetical protein [Verrucomicrobiota bacterium]